MSRYSQMILTAWLVASVALVLGIVADTSPPGTGWMWNGYRHVPATPHRVGP